MSCSSRVLNTFHHNPETGSCKCMQHTHAASRRRRGRRTSLRSCRGAAASRQSPSRRCTLGGTPRWRPRFPTPVATHAAWRTCTAQRDTTPGRQASARPAAATPGAPSRNRGTSRRCVRRRVLQVWGCAQQSGDMHAHTRGMGGGGGGGQQVGWTVLVRRGREWSAYAWGSVRESPPHRCSRPGSECWVRWGGNGMRIGVTRERTAGTPGHTTQHAARRASSCGCQSPTRGTCTAQQPVAASAATGVQSLEWQHACARQPRWRCSLASRGCQVQSAAARTTRMRSALRRRRRRQPQRLRPRPERCRERISLGRCRRGARCERTHAPDWTGRRQLRLCHPQPRLHATQHACLKAHPPHTHSPPAHDMHAHHTRYWTGTEPLITPTASCDHFVAAVPTVSPYFRGGPDGYAGSGHCSATVDLRVSPRGRSHDKRSPRFAPG